MHYYGWQRRALAVFSWRFIGQRERVFCGSLLTRRVMMVNLCGNGLIELKGCWECRVNKRWKDLIPIGQLMTSISFTGAHLCRADLFSPSVLRSDFGKVIVSSLLLILYHGTGEDFFFIENEQSAFRKKWNYSLLLLSLSAGFLLLETHAVQVQSFAVAPRIRETGFPVCSLQDRFRFIIPLRWAHQNEYCNHRWIVSNKGKKLDSRTILFRKRPLFFSHEPLIAQYFLENHFVCQEFCSIPFYWQI